MDMEFKVPSIEPKVKFVPRKSKEAEPVDTAVDTQDDTPVDTAEIVVKEDEPSATVKPVEKTPATATPTTKSSCPYKEPHWSRCPDATHSYSFEVLKGGQIVENIRDLQTKAFWPIGKLPDNSIVMAHPTISRYHAVLQYRPETVDDSSSDSEDEGDNSTPEKPKVEKGWYLYDLGSTHGSFVNKMRVPPKTYIRLRVGYMLKFGASTRNYILQGPNFDEETESELTITEMKELRLKKEQERKDKLIEEEKRKEAEGVSWGMGDDADEETDLSVNPFAATNNEELFLQDPKRTLRGFFEREGFDLEYKVDEMAAGSYICRIELPITDSFGRNIIAEFSHKGKKKECVVQCALEACRILDRHGVLRQANHEPQRKRKAQSSDDDDDEFYDRTTEAEEKRKRKAAAEENAAKSYEQLMEEETNIQQTIAEVEQRISKYQEQDKLAKQRRDEEDDDLDDFMSHLSNVKALDKTEIKKLRFELQRLKNELAKTKKLINIARPLELPPLKPPTDSPSKEATKKPALPLFGKKRTFGFGKPVAVPAKSAAKLIKIDDSTQEERNVEEFDDDDDEDVSGGGDTSESTSEPVAIVEKHEVSKDPSTSEERKIATARKSERKKDLKVADAPVESSSTPSPSKAVTPEVKTVEQSSSSAQDELTESHDTEDIAATEDKPSSKRKRNRCRNRGDKGREKIDMDDIEEPLDSEKYSKWVPPENQSGDGFTDLNSKYGY